MWIWERYSLSDAARHLACIKQSDILEIHFLFVVDLFRYIVCKGTNKTTMAVVN